jgi:outer membrane autotransporter protein
LLLFLSIWTSMSSAIAAQNQARHWWVLKSGKVVSAPKLSAAKSEAFCLANPDVALDLMDLVAGPTELDVDERGGTASFSIQVQMLAQCLDGEVSVTLNYGALGGSADLGAAGDAVVVPAVVRFDAVPQFSLPVNSGGQISVTGVDDELIEDDETIELGLTGGSGVQVLDQFVDAFLVSADPDRILATVTIISDDTIPIGDSVDELLPFDPVARELAAALDDICAAQNQDPELLAQCQAIRAGLEAEDASGVQSALRGLAPEEVATQSSSVVEIRSGSQTDRVQGRLANLRGSGAARRAATSTTLSFRADGLPFSFDQLLQSDDGGDMGGGLLGSRWGGFISGDAGRGDRGTTARENGFDFDRWGITGGLDYRISDAWFAGAALGFNRFDADLQGDGGRLESDILALTLYSSYSFAGGGYIEGSIGKADFDFDQARRIVYSVGGLSIDRTATAGFDAEQLVGTLAAGYPIVRGEWLFTPSVGIEWSRTDTDSFTETGAGSLNLFVRGQDVYSTLSNLNLQISRTISFSGGVLVPYFNATYYSEGSNESRPTIARFVSDVSGTLISIGSDEPDTSYAQFGVGVNWLTVAGIQLYADYRRVSGLDDFSLKAFSVGGKLEF